MLSKKIENKIPDITDIATTVALNAKINEVKDKIRNITNFSYCCWEQIPNVSNLVKKLSITQKLLKLEIKLLLTMIITNALLLAR